MSEFLIGCSGWNYTVNADKGGWTGVFSTSKDTKDYAMVWDIVASSQLGLGYLELNMQFQNCNVSGSCHISST